MAVNNTKLHTLINKDISLSSDHVYTLKETNTKTVFYDSVTKIVESQFKPFDKELIAKSLVRNVPKYSHMEYEDLILEWDQKRDYGTKVHKQLEKYILSKKNPTLSLAKVGSEWFDTSRKKYGNDVYPEVKVFSKAHALAGTVDLVIYNKEKDGCYIFDWKTSGSDIYKRKGTGITSITSDLPDSNYTKYELQLSMYRYLMQEFHNVKIINQFILHIKDAKVEVIRTKYLKSHSKRILKELLEKNIYDEENDYVLEKDDWEDWRKSDEYKLEIESAVSTIKKLENDNDRDGDLWIYILLFICLLFIINAFCFSS